MTTYTVIRVDMSGYGKTELVGPQYDAPAPAEARAARGNERAAELGWKVLFRAMTTDEAVKRAQT